MFNKKSQAAMEFLMTYGWAVILVLIGVGALIYLGVFNPSIPTTCNLVSPFVCQDTIIAAFGSPTSIHAIALRIGATNIDSATISNIREDGVQCPNTAITVDGVATQDITNARTTPVVVQCSMGSTKAPGTKVSGTFDIAYTKQFGLLHRVTGTYSGTVEST